MDNHRDDAADVLVIFGITGDLARRMTFRALYRLERRGLLDFPPSAPPSVAIEVASHARRNWSAAPAGCPRTRPSRLPGTSSSAGPAGMRTAGSRVPGLDDGPCPGEGRGYNAPVERVVHVPYTVEQDETGWWCAHAPLPGGGANGEGQTRRRLSPTSVRPSTAGSRNSGCRRS